MPVRWKCLATVAPEALKDLPVDIHLPDRVHERLQREVPLQNLAGQKTAGIAAGRGPKATRRDAPETRFDEICALGCPDR